MIKWIKIGGLVLSAAGMAVDIGSKFIERKSIVSELAKSKEIEELVAKTVAEALKNR